MRSVIRGHDLRHVLPWEGHLFLQMELYIDVQTSVYEVQRAFYLSYPCLKMEFFVELPVGTGGEGQLGALRRRRIPGESVFPFPYAHGPVHINIDGSCTVHDVITEFREKFNFIAIISRRSGNAWVNTSLTENWTLSRQNEEGEEWSRNIVQ